MDVIVPLAGPDFVRSDGSVKALMPIHGEPMLWHILKSRPWSDDSVRYSFILIDCIETRTFASQYLAQWCPNSNVIFLSTHTRGAALTVLAGIALEANNNSPLIVDLADILYSSNIDIRSRLSSSSACGGIAFVFKSANPAYSYLRCDDDGKVIEAAEKRVISANASAGTYVFRDSSTYLRAVAHALYNQAGQTHNGLYYVCPLFNGVLDQGFQVELEPVDSVFDVKNGG